MGDAVSNLSLSDLITGGAPAASAAPPQIKLSAIRSQFPMYSDLNDDQLLSGIRQKFYPDIPMGQFVKRIDYDTQRAALNPVNDMDEGERFRAGLGAGMQSVLRAVGGGKLMEKLGLPGLPSTAAEAAQTDAPLMNTGAAQVGKVVGQVAPALLAVPFTPATLPGAVTAGALTGAATTEGGVGDRSLGAAAGAAGGALGAAAPVVYNVGKGIVKGLVEPVTQAGRQRIAGRAIQQFTTDPAAVASASGAPTVTGAVPTLAEAASDPGIATLQRALSTMDPDAAAAFAARGQANNAARLQTLQGIADIGAPARATRSAAAKTSYGAAEQAGIDPAVAESMRPQIEALLSRPSIKAAQADAQSLAAEQGLNIGDNTSVQGLQFLKQALDDRIGKAIPGSNEFRAMTQTARDLNLTLEQLSPGFSKANAEFAQNSVPVNQADVAQRLLDKTTGAIRDFSGNQPLQANKFSTALNDEGQLLKTATGQRQYKELADLMTPDQMAKIGGVRNELEILANLGNAANGAGSQTAKMLASQNMVRQIAGPLGLPDSLATNAISEALQRVPSFAMKTFDARIQKELSEALLDPAKALDFLARAKASDMRLPPGQLQQLLQRAAPALANAGTSRGANRAN